MILCVILVPGIFVAAFIEINWLMMVNARRWYQVCACAEYTQLLLTVRKPYSLPETTAILAQLSPTHPHYHKHSYISSLGECTSLRG